MISKRRVISFTSNMLPDPQCNDRITLQNLLEQWAMLYMPCIYLSEYMFFFFLVLGEKQLGKY